MQSRQSNVAPVADRLDWKIIAPLCLSTFTVFLGGQTIAPLAVDIADDLKTSVPLIAQTMTIGLVAMGLFGLVSGPLADVVGQRRSMLTGLSILTGGSIVLGIAPTYAALLLGGLIAGVGASMSIGPAFGLAAMRFNGDLQRKAISRIQAAGTFASIVGAPILTTIASLTLWRGAFVATVISNVVAVLMIIRWMAPDPPRTRASLSAGNILGAYQPLLRNVGMLSIYACTLIRSMSWFAGVFFLGAFFDDKHGLSLGQIGLIYMLTGIGQFTGNIVAGGRLGNVDQRTLYVISTVMLAVSWVGVYALELPAAVAILLAALAAMATGAGWISLQSILASESPAGAGTTMTLNVSISALGWAIGSAAGGVLIAAGGYQSIGLVFPLFALLAACGPLAWDAERSASARRESAS